MGDDILPAKNAEYRTAEYWEERYVKDGQSDYDWFKTYAEIRQYITANIDRSARILHLGCGNSTLAADMADDGYGDIVNIDFSPSCIEAMKTKYVDYPKLSWYTMDMKDLKFDDGEFDVVLDKGTLDAIWTDESKGVTDDVHQICTEISRVCKAEGGKWVMMSFGQPHLRRMYLDKPEYDWGLTWSTIGGAGFFQYFLYVLTRGTKTVIEVPKEILEYPEEKKVNAYVDGSTLDGERGEELGGGLWPDSDDSD